MDNFGAVRALAYTKHKAMREKAGGVAKAVALLAAARLAERVTTNFVVPEHPLLAGGDGALHRSSETPSIYVSSAAAPDVAAYIEAHEFGHLWIETSGDPVVVPRGSDPGAPEEPTPLGLRRVEAYSPHELRERHANVFGREFLLPREEARKLFVQDGQSALEIAVDLGLPIGLVQQQLAAALLLPDIPDLEDDGQKPEKPGLDPSQVLAAEHTGTPLLVEAGPGTGKTRTLIARIEHLLGKGVPAPSILVLTFSNKAAAEIRERVAASMPAAAAELWAGTFHAFGLELVRKLGHLDNIKQPVRLLDQADQLVLLERDLPQLGLDHYLRLHEPLMELKHIVGAISRAKDEVFSPARYIAAAAEMQKVAKIEEERVKADKAAEVGRVYAHYENQMRSDGVVDFADLINRPIEILRGNPDIRNQIQGQYTHVLVDEYQDVNRASALLLKEIAGDGKQLWVVGDARQSIYRFRGAAPVNTKDFEKDYPCGQRKSLDVNYRSRKQIVDTFGGYAREMHVGKGRPSLLRANRGEGANAVDFHLASDRDAEIAGIAETIAKRRADGVAYKDQAVLCRVHSNLEKIALGLEAAGIPILYIGDLFERPEVRDLLALISFVSEPHRGGLYRVATLNGYRMSLQDVRMLLDHAAGSDQTPLEALRDAAALDGLTDVGRAALLRLAGDLGFVGYKTGPGAFLRQMLFNQPGLVRGYLAGDTPADQQRRLAIHQFLQFAIENDGTGEGDPKRRMLRWIRRLEVFGDERALRDPPAAIAGIDAVRLMTVHASKGLEFKVVHMPALGAGLFPLKWQGQRCPAPAGMLSTVAADDHGEEEECLFFVALSRARDHLSLSRALRYSDKQGSNASEALRTISSHLPRPIDGAPGWTGRLPWTMDPGIRADFSVATKDHDGRDLELYLGCPRRYLYQKVLGLSGSREDNGYVQFHRVVYRVLRWMGEKGEDISAGATFAEFERAWAEFGPLEHPLQEIFQAAARRILDQALGRSRTGIVFGETLVVRIDTYNIALPIDEIERGNTVIIRRLRTGRPPKKPDQRVLHALMAEAGRQAHNVSVGFELQYLTTNEAVAVTLSGVMASRLEKTRTALRELAGGVYPAKPENREDCPRCPHYFICPTVPE